MSENHLVRKSKICPLCKISKSIDEFWRDNNRKFRLGNYCKPCGRLKDSIRGKTEKYKIAHRKHQANYRLKNPLKMKAHQLIVPKRKELLSKNCSTCGSTKNLQLHHPDYTKPLKTITLCVYCHEKVHHG